MHKRRIIAASFLMTPYLRYLTGHRLENLKINPNQKKLEFPHFFVTGISYPGLMPIQVSKELMLKHARDFKINLLTPSVMGFTSEQGKILCVHADFRTQLLGFHV